MTRKQKKAIIRILSGLILLIIAFFLPLENQWSLLIFIPAYLIVGGDVVIKAIRNIASGQIFDENFLMTIATIGAFFTAEYSEGVAVMLFYQVGEFFQDYAVNRSRKSISELMDIRPDYANVLRNQEILTVDPEEIEIGEKIIIKPGEKVPLDGIVIEGFSMLDTSALTGESIPREVSIGSEVLSGCINQNGLLTIEVKKEFGESTVSKILDLVENASSKKANAENFITKFAKYYTPIVVLCAVLLAVIPPLFLGVSDGAIWSNWVHRALIFLVISCPCALVISIPLSFFGGIGGASKAGILIKGSNYLEALANTEIVVFDKTGTLTKGNFAVTEIYPENNISKEDLLELTAYAESNSSHPISVSIVNAYSKIIDNSRIKEVEEIGGHGVKAIIDGKNVYAGNYRLMDDLGITYKKANETGTIIYVAINNLYSGYIIIADEIKPDAKDAINSLKQIGVLKTVMLTGDTTSVGEKVAKELGIDKVYTQLLPADKVEKLEELLSEKSKTGKLVFVGDGINDTPVLARADIGIAMGGLGSDAAIEASDIVIMNDQPSKITEAIQISKKTLVIVKQNITFALTIKILVMILGAIGLANMWFAVFADVGVSVIAILNAMRALSVKNTSNK